MKHPDPRNIVLKDQFQKSNNVRNRAREEAYETKDCESCLQICRLMMSEDNGPNVRDDQNPEMPGKRNAAVTAKFRRGVPHDARSSLSRPGTRSRARTRNTHLRSATPSVCSRSLAV